MGKGEGNDWGEVPLNESGTYKARNSGEDSKDIQSIGGGCSCYTGR